MHFIVMAGAKKKSGLSCDTGKNKQIAKYIFSFSSIQSYPIPNGNI